MDYKEAYEALLKEWKHLNNKVNKVTAPYRHGNGAHPTALTNLCNAQQDVWDNVNKIEHNVKKHDI